MKSTFHKNKNNYNYNIFLEKFLYQLPKNYDNKYVFVSIINASERIDVNNTSESKECDIC